MNIRQYLQTALSAVTLKDDAFTLDMKKGFIIIVCVGLIVGLVSATRTASVARRQQEFSQDEFEKGMEQAFVGMENVPREVQENIKYYMSQIPVYVRLGKQTAVLHSPLRPYLAFIGEILSGPFGFMGFWIFYGALVYIFSIWLGGAGNAERTFAATSLWSIPHLLKVGTILPWAGWLFSSVAWLWGIAIYIKGISVSQGFDLSKSVLVFLLPIVALIALAILAITLFILVVS